MRIFLFLIVICLVFFSCQSENKQERVVEWIDETSNENVLYEFDTSRLSLSSDKIYTREVNAASNIYKLSWQLEFAPLNIKGQPVLAPIKIRPELIVMSSNFEIPYNHKRDYDLQVVFNPDRSFYYLISLCEVFKEKNRTIGMVTINNNESISSKKLQQLILTYPKIDTISTEFSKRRWYSNIPSGCDWCKQLKVIPLDTTLIISEVTQDSLPIVFDEFDNIKITESGNYLDTLRFRKEDLMMYQRNYR